MTSVDRIRTGSFVKLEDLQECRYVWKLLHFVTLLREMVMFRNVWDSIPIRIIWQKTFIRIPTVSWIVQKKVWIAKSICDISNLPGSILRVHTYTSSSVNVPCGKVVCNSVLSTTTVTLFCLPNCMNEVISRWNGKWPISCCITQWPFIHYKMKDKKFLGLPEST